MASRCCCLSICPISGKYRAQRPTRMRLRFTLLKLYIILIAALGVFIVAIGRRSAPSAMMQIPAKQRKLSRRTMVATVLILLFIPLTIFAGVMYLGNQHYNITAFLVLMECMLPFFLVFESRKPKARELVTIAVLCVIGVAGRSAFFMLPQFKPVLALVIISGVAFGGETGFLVGAVTMMVSNVLFSQGTWMPCRCSAWASSASLPVCCSAKVCSAAAVEVSLLRCICCCHHLRRYHESRCCADVQFTEHQPANAYGLLCIRTSYGSDSCSRYGDLHPHSR